MKTYRLKEGSFKEQEKKLLKRGIFFLFLAGGAGFTMSTINQGFNIKVFAIWLPIAAVAAYYGLRRGMRIQREAWESYALKWDGNSLVKSQIRTGDVTISILEITSIEEIEKGAVIKTTKKFNSIFIPNELEHYSELIAELKSVV